MPENTASAATCPYCGGTSGFSFDRTLCACGSMHDYCEDCGNALDCPLDAPVVQQIEAPSAASRPWRWPTYSRLALENKYQRNFIRGQQAEVEQLRAALDLLLPANGWHTVEEVLRDLAVRG